MKNILAKKGLHKWENKKFKSFFRDLYNLKKLERIKKQSCPCLVIQV